jgi:hypothetical protein
LVVRHGQHLVERAARGQVGAASGVADTQQQLRVAWAVEERS